MKCNKCGAQIPEGKLYCSECGEEIHMVPIFEPEMETRIDENMSRIGADVATPKQNSERTDQKSGRNHYPVFVMIVVICIVLCILSLKYFFSSSEYLINRGNQCADRQEYVEAIRYYEQVPYMEESYHFVISYLVSCYEKLQDEDQYEKYLLLLINSPYSSTEQTALAYEELISYYVQKKSYQSIDSLLKDCNNKSIVKLYEEYMVSEPSFSYEAGYYKEIIPLKIRAGEGETVYYTTDGSEPTVESEVFSMPLFMYEGEYEIKAISVNKYGVVSKVVTKEYQIEL